MPRPSFLPIFLVCISVVALVPLGHCEQLDVIVSATATDEYLAASSQLEYQTYHVIKGKSFGGSAHDSDLQFEEIAHSLSKPLSEYRMYLETDHSAGDLLIMISWGRTLLEHNDSSAKATSDRAENQRSRNLVLLGLQSTFRPTTAFGNSANEAIWDELDEERYFVILNAFDYQHLLRHKELKQVWSIRCNTTTEGLSLEQAYSSIANSLDGVVGSNSGELLKIKTNFSSQPLPIQ